MTKSERSPKPEIRTKRSSPVIFGLRISDLIRHSSFVIRHSSLIPLDNDETRMTKSERSPKPEIRTKPQSPVAFDIRISFVIRPSDFGFDSSLTAQRFHRIGIGSAT